MTKENYNHIYVYTKEIIDELYKDNAFTVIGLALESEYDEDYIGENELVKWINETAEVKFNNDILDLYILRGSTVNELYGLKNPYVYPNDFNIVCVKRKDINNYETLTNRKYKIGAKWFQEFIAILPINKT